MRLWILLSSAVFLVLALSACGTQAQPICTGLCELGEDEVWQYGDEPEVGAQASDFTSRAELAAKIAQSTGLPPKDVTAVLSHYEAHLKDALAMGHQVRLDDFGAFRLTRRKARTGVLPGTTQPVTIPASTSVSFKAYKPLYCGVDPTQARCR